MTMTMASTTPATRYRWQKASIASSREVPGDRKYSSHQSHGVHQLGPADHILIFFARAACLGG